MLARIDASPAADPEHHIGRKSLGDVRLPAAVASAGLERRKWLAPGLWTAAVRAPRTEGWRTLLLRAPARMRIPKHEHGGRELIAVLQGAFRDGHIYAAGDFEEHESGSGHSLAITSDGPCACLISVQGQAHWHGWARIVAPLVGM
ncbi:cupin domain-containing protein [Phenylobacterium sp.]|uniref:cupin domain-containing protein n=1 Tax=Phenylobacterium sp. TaxID=1871053 RepID=UPI003458F45E